MRRALLALTGASALGVLVLLLGGFVWPDVDHEFELGRAEDFAPGSVTSFYLPPDRAAIRTLLPDEVIGDGCRTPGTILHLVRLEDGSLLALWGRSTHLGQMLPWRPDFSFDGSLGWFRDPCQASTFAMDGTRVFGPAPRDLDRFALRIEEGRVLVDVTDVTEGDRMPQYRPTAPPPGWTPQPTALATEPPGQ